MLKVAMYSHDSVGLGHARRNRAIAHALAEYLPALTGQEVSGFLIAGHPDATQDSLPAGWDWLVLPGYARVAEGYAARSLGFAVEELVDLRAAAVRAALEAVGPDLFIADRHPFGVGDELRPALEMLRARHQTTTILGMREVLDTPSVVQQEWEDIGGAEAAAAMYDAVWIYGDEAVHNPLATGELPALFTDRAYFTGYLSKGRPADVGEDAEVPYVLTIVGGGSDGGHITRAAAAARVPPGHRHLIVTGPQMPSDDVRAARSLAAANLDAGRIKVLHSASNVPALIREAAAVVSMAGYNSLAEVMATSTPALVVPRNTRRAEQPMRASDLAALGAVDVLPAERLSPTALGEWFAGAVHRRTTREGIRLDGLAEVGRLAAELINSRHSDVKVPDHAA
ncbi:glycosyltransferase family protein [Tessaracoccus rhinocerotis]|uniref:glycosyltransferase family protein n=1 Tax=Tessaracoccus rhinocerotis TaxID=1689449 RepID=UPI001C8F5F3E|nr:glycosyltransferase [Tessaracoccus rhinocerotis]